MEFFGPALLILGLAMIPIIALVMNGTRRIREREVRHRERMRALELGVELPPETDATPKRSRNGGSPIGLHGVIWFAVGLGLISTRAYLYSGVYVDDDLRGFVNFLSIWGLPSLFVGIGLMMYAFATRKSRRNGNGGAASGPPAMPSSE